MSICKTGNITKIITISGDKSGAGLTAIADNDILFRKSCGEKQDLLYNSILGAMMKRVDMVALKATALTGVWVRIPLAP